MQRTRLDMKRLKETVLVTEAIERYLKHPLKRDGAGYGPAVRSTTATTSAPSASAPMAAPGTATANANAAATSSISSPRSSGARLSKQPISSPIDTRVSDLLPDANSAAH